MARARGRSMGFLDITIDLPATYSLGGGKQIGRALVSVEVLECSCAGARPRRLACGIPRLARVQKQYRLERQLPYGPPLLEPTSSGRFRRVLRQEAAEGAEPSGRRGKKGPSSTERKKNQLMFIAGGPPALQETQQGASEQLEPSLVPTPRPESGEDGAR